MIGVTSEPERQALGQYIGLPMGMAVEANNLTHLAKLAALQWGTMAIVNRTQGGLANPALFPTSGVFFKEFPAYFYEQVYTKTLQAGTSPAMAAGTAAATTDQVIPVYGKSLVAIFSALMSGKPAAAFHGVTKNVLSFNETDPATNLATTMTFLGGPPFNAPLPGERAVCWMK